MLKRTEVDGIAFFRAFEKVRELKKVGGMTILS